MRVAVLGAGVTGVTTAWALARAGAEVLVLDREPEVANGTSHANAAQLSYSFVDSLATPDFLPHIPGILLGRDLGAKVRLDSHVIRWGLRFLGECRASRSQATTLELLRLAHSSADLLAQLLDETSIEFDYRRAGKLVLLANERAVEQARASTELKRQNGSDVRLLGKDESRQIEPTLDVMHEPYAGTLYSEADTVGDACTFSRRLAEVLERKHSVNFRLGANIKSIDVHDGRARGVNTTDERFETDAMVICLGTGSRELLEPLGLSLPIIPVRGYSVTLPIGERPPETSVTSLKNHFVFTRLGDRMRVAGFTDFRGYDTRHDAARIADLLRIARESAPLAADYEASENNAWGGYRPMTPDSRPRVGRTPISGLHLNTGHGMLGWTLAPATAQAVAESVLAA